MTGPSGDAGSGAPVGAAQTSGAKAPGSINLKWIGAIGGLFIGLTAAAEMGLARPAAAVAALIAFSTLLVWGEPLAQNITKAVKG